MVVETVPPSQDQGAFHMCVTMILKVMDECASFYHLMVASAWFTKRDHKCKFSVAYDHPLDDNMKTAELGGACCNTWHVQETVQEMPVRLTWNTGSRRTLAARVMIREDL